MVFQVHHHIEGDYGDTDVRFVLLQNFLGLIGSIEGLPVGVLARSGVVAADDEVCTAMIFPDERVPDGLARSAHAHRERQQR